MGYELLEKMKVKELKNYLKIRVLQVTGKKTIGSPSICCQGKWSSTYKNSGRKRIRFNDLLQKQT